MQSVIHVVGDDKYKVMSAYVASLGGVVEHVKKEARNAQLEPQRGNWPGVR